MSSNNPASINARFETELKAMARYLQQARDHSLNSEFITMREELLRHFRHSVTEFLHLVPHYLESKNIATDGLSERESIRQLQLTGLINNDDHRLLHQMLDDQYKAAHEPSKSEAEKLESRIREYFRILAMTGQKIAAALGLKGELQLDSFDLP